MQRKTVSLACETFIGGDSFVQVMDAKITGLQDQAHLQLYVMNLHSFMLTGLEYEAVFYNSANIKINEVPHKFKADNLNIDTSRIELVSDKDISPLFPKASRASVKLLKGYFSDSNELDLVYDNMETVVLESLDQRDHYMLKQVAGEDAFSLASQHTLTWRCVCGYFNSDDSVFCSNCAREKDQALGKYKSMDQIRPLASVEEEPKPGSQESSDDEETKTENEKEEKKGEKRMKINLPDLDPFFKSFEDLPKFVWGIGYSSLAFMLVTFIILLIYRYR